MSETKTMSIEDIEMSLAELLAEAYARDPSYVDLVTKMGLDPDDEAVIEGYESGLVDLALDRIQAREAARARPRSAIEAMVDMACGRR